MGVKENLQKIKSELPEGVTLVCVSKFNSNEAIMDAYNAGVRDFGESRVQELLPKQEALPEDIRWHFIGPLQTNKIRQIVPFVHLIQSVENFRQMDEIQKRAEAIEREVNILIQIHISQEEHKFGFSEEEAREIFSQDILAKYPNIRVCGLMGMASLTDDMEQVRREFAGLKRLFDEFRKDYPQLQHLSFGMSDDYPIALEEGSNMIRVGSKIFGSRVYK